MATAGIVEQVRARIYGTGLYEKPVLVQLALTGNTGITGGIQTLTFNSGETPKPGAVLSSIDGDVNNSFAMYVVRNPTATTADVLFGYHGSSIPGGGGYNLQGYIFEHNPKVTEWEIHEAVRSIINAYLWPDLFMFEEGSIANPNLSTFQDEVPSGVERILSAHQIVSNVVVPVEFGLAKNLHVTLSSTGNLAWFKYHDGTPLYYTYQRRLLENDWTSPGYEWLEELQVVGAAALLMDSGGPPLVGSYRPNIIDVTPQQAAADAMWRNFIQTREAARLTLSRDLEHIRVIH